MIFIPMLCLKKKFLNRLKQIDFVYLLAIEVEKHTHILRGIHEHLEIELNYITLHYFTLHYVTIRYNYKTVYKYFNYLMVLASI